MSGLNTLSNVANALSQGFAADLMRQYNRVTVLGEEIPSEFQGNNGKNVAWDVMMGGQTASSYAEGSDVSAGEFTVDQPLPATLSWGNYRSAFQISENQINAAWMSKSSATDIVQIVRERMLSAVSALASAENVDLWSGTGTDGSGNPNIVGLTGGALAATGTYATIDRTSYPLWAGNVLSNGGVDRALTLDLLEQAEENIYNASGMTADKIVCSSGVWRKYVGLFEPIRRVAGMEQPSEYGTSVQNRLFFKGIPVIRDKDAPAGTLVFLNTEVVKKVYLPEIADASMDAVVAREVPGVGVSGKLRTPLQLPFKFEALAKTGDSVKFMCKSVLNLKVGRPNACALVQDISES